jgi:hypothetical protein
MDGQRRGTDAPAEVGWLTWGYTVSEIEKLAETHTSTLDTWAISSLLLSLSREQELEKFLAGIPGFYRSTRVENPAEVLRESNTNILPKAIVAFVDHSLTSDLVSDTTRRQRISVSLKAIQADSYLLQRTFYHSLGFIESARFHVRRLRSPCGSVHANDDDPDVRLLARCIIAVAINSPRRLSYRRALGRHSPARAELVRVQHSLNIVNSATACNSGTSFSSHGN